MKKRLAVLLCLMLFGGATIGSSIQASAADVVNGSYVKSDNENNPLVTQNYGADPGVMVYNDTVYIYTTNDSQELAGNNENTYGKINQLNCYSSKDLVNWTDHGSFNVAGSNGAARWASNSWAPCITYKKINGKDKFFLYFANNASGIGVLTSDSPTGPWADPIGKALVTGHTAGCSGVTWMFDPAVFVDSDGTGYLYFGGGIPNGQAAHPKTARVIKLGADMISTSGSAVTIDAPYLFEDSGINKIGNTYYYSYCSNWNCANGFNNAAIEYMTSSSPMGPFTYVGEIMKNPGVFFPGSTGNNHHSIFEFKGSYYMAYHTRSVESKVIGKSLGYRTTQIDRLNVSGGRISSLTPSMSGVAQSSYVDPYQTVQAETIFTQAGIGVYGYGDGRAVVTNIQNGDYTKIKGVNFSNGLKTITASVNSRSNGSIEVRDGSPYGTLLGTIAVSSTNGQFKEFTGNMSSVSGVKNICFVFKGSFDFDQWVAGGNNAPSTPEEPQPSQGETKPVNENETVRIEDGWYYIKGVQSQKYLTVDADNANGWKNVVIKSGSGVDAQKWYLTNVNDGYVTLTNKLGSVMLDVANGENIDGANVGIYQGYGGNAQQFTVKSTANNGIYTIGTKASGATKYLDVYEHKSADGTNVCQWTYNGNPNQQWQFEKVDGQQSQQPAEDPQPATDPEPEQPDTPVDPEPVQEPEQPDKPADPEPVAEPADGTGVILTSTVNSWGSGYTISFKVTNNGNQQVKSWTLKLKSSDIDIASSWNVNVKEDGDYIVITPVEWNSVLEPGQSAEFGMIGNGAPSDSIAYEIN
ncbi:MAG: family 43 glycosylhydrolase [Butyrivibrio sp.]|nr:family 43 glycosylhydrolase [Butyrivibrio sp.]